MPPARTPEINAWPRSVALGIKPASLLPRPTGEDTGGGKTQTRSTKMSCSKTGDLPDCVFPPPCPPPYDGGGDQTYEAISFTPGAANSVGQTTFHSLFCTCLTSWAASPWLNGPSKRRLPQMVVTRFFLSQSAMFSSSRS